jgi:hypothetical protein
MGSGEFSGSAECQVVLCASRNSLNDSPRASMDMCSLKKVYSKGEVFGDGPELHSSSNVEANIEGANPRSPLDRISPNVLCHKGRSVTLSLERRLSFESGSGLKKCCRTARQTKD